MTIVATKTIDQFIIGSDPVKTHTALIKVGQGVLPAFTPMMMEMSTGKLIAYDKAKIATDITAYILPEAVDTTAADVSMGVFSGGRFNAEMVAWTSTPSAIQQLTAFVGTPISLDTLFKG